MFLFLLLTATVLASSSAQNAPPFCNQLCTCTVRDSNTYEVTCTRDITSYLFNSSYWINAENNQTWPYKSIKIENSPILTLKDQFARSDVVFLSLSNNSIVNISDGIFSNLQSMETLVLSYNNIEVIHPDAFMGQYLEGDFNPLKSLKKLYMAHNRIHSLDADLFEHTSRVEVLDLSHNPIKVIDHQTLVAITSLVYLHELDLSYTQLTSLPDYFLHTPKFLYTLDLSGNLFEKVPQTLADSHNLTTLYFNNNPIVNLTSENGFPSVPTLKILHISSMPKLVNVSREALSNLEDLEELYCFGNPELVHFDKAALSKKREDAEYATWPPIKKLYLQNNKITRIDMQIILQWKDLTALDLTDNPWTCECENQWMIDELMPIYLQIDENKAKSLTCAAPIEMAGLTFYDEYNKQSTMRCLDLYGHRPERDGILLVGILAGVLITIPIILCLIYAYQRHWFGIFDSSPAAFSRQFYKRTMSSEEGYL